MSIELIVIGALLIAFIVNQMVLLAQAQRIEVLERRVAALPKPDPLTEWAATDGAAALASLEQDGDGCI